MTQTADIDPDLFNPRTRAAAEADNRLFVEFYLHYVKDEEASVKEGRPIFRDAEFVRILVPGDRNNVIERPVDEFDRRRFAARYERWKASGEASQDVGTKLEQWPLVTRSQVEEYRYFGVRTVEQLADVHDTACSKVPGMADMRDKAQAWLAATKDTKAAEKLQSELKERDDKILNLEQALAQMQGELAALSAAQPKVANSKR